MKLPVSRSHWPVLLMLPVFVMTLPGCFPVVATGMVAGAMSIVTDEQRALRPRTRPLNSRLQAAFAIGLALTRPFQQAL